jgi:hypothetical protein
MSIPPGNPFAGKSILDLESVRADLERKLEVLGNPPSPTDTWAKEVQGIEAQLVQVRTEISVAGTSVVQ